MLKGKAKPVLVTPGPFWWLGPLGVMTKATLGFCGCLVSPFGGDSILFFDFRAICEHSEFAFSAGIL